MKLGRPRPLDATALCIGSMMPDLLFTVSAYFEFDTHRSPITFWAGVPIAAVVALVVRVVLAPVGPAQLPDLGEFRLHSWAVLAARRPGFLVTAASAFLGVGSHIVVDWFTHPGRRGVRWLGYENVNVVVLGVSRPLADGLQIIGHSFGSLTAVAMLWLIGRRRLLDDWYGAHAVAAARRWNPSSRQRVVFWCGVGLGLLGGVIWGTSGNFLEMTQRTFVGALAGSIVAAAAIRRGPAAPWPAVSQAPAPATKPLDDSSVG